MSEHLHLSVALDGAGWHPWAWKDARVRPAALFGADYWIEQVATAERGLLDFVTIEDSFALQTGAAFTHDDRTDHVTGRLDAVELAARIAPETTRIGLVPSTDTLQTEPFHLASALATVDFASRGRAGWRVRAGGARESENFGRRETFELTLDWYRTPEGQAQIARQFDEAVDVIEVVRRLWDSWDDDAVIRDVPTGRFFDRDRVHHVNFESSSFSIAGPSITPRPPQGQVVVTALGHATVPYRLAARGADVLFVTPTSTEDAARIVAEVRELEIEVGRTLPPLRIFADLVVLIDATSAAASTRLERWNELDGAAYVSDAFIVAASASELADLLEEWRDAGIEGYRLRPASAHLDLPAIADQLVPELQRRGIFRHEYEGDTLRGHLGLDRPANRYATATAPRSASTAQNTEN
ncbi:LLM class flavin-dependent oxidoreductase [Glaciihabitans sp. dw_435]|uniref:LLM class flavin-dependent oxidoreductase n=1 Tax=Glaciihabitans sp. dw_435 TaxID=2720081 RepID=UPI001BD35019|nr:LLM class flavin-dependent oxidoreductase [Glaciihabitans sp. dw_435]